MVFRFAWVTEEQNVSINSADSSTCVVLSKLKQLFTSGSVTVVDIYHHFGK